MPAERPIVFAADDDPMQLALVEQTLEERTRFPKSTRNLQE